MRDTAPRIDLIPAVALEREAEAFELGELRYGHQSWRTAGDCRTDCLNHAFRHLARYAEGDRSEDHLGHARANLAIILDLEEQESRQIAAMGALGCVAQEAQKGK